MYMHDNMKRWGSRACWRSTHTRRNLTIRNNSHSTRGPRDWTLLAKYRRWREWSTNCTYGILQILSTITTTYPRLYTMGCKHSLLSTISPGEYHSFKIGNLRFSILDYQRHCQQRGGQPGSIPSRH